MQIVTIILVSCTLLGVCLLVIGTRLIGEVEARGSGIRHSNDDTQFAFDESGKVLERKRACAQAIQTLGLVLVLPAVLAMVCGIVFLAVVWK